MANQWNNGNRFYKGQNQDAEDRFMSKEQAREIRNARRTEDGSDFHGYTNREGFSDISTSPQLNPTSSVINIKWIDWNVSTNLNETYVFTVGSNTYVVNATWIYQDSLHAQRTIRDAINNANTPLKAATVGNGVIVWFDNGADSYYNIQFSPTSYTTSKIVIKRSKRNLPIAHWNFSDNEQIILSKGLGSGFLNQNSDQIWSVQINTDGTWGTQTLLYNNKIGFSLEHKPIVKGVDENNCYKRIYWTDNNKPFYTANLENDDLMAITPKNLEVFSPYLPNIVQITGVEDNGALKSSMIQYMYRLSTSNGSETTLSPASQLVPIVAGTQNGITQEYRGALAGTDCAKAVRGIIKGIPLEFTRIQIIAVYWESYNAITRVEQFLDAEVMGAEFEFLHTGTETVLPLELSSIYESGPSWRYCKDLEIHDNYLIALNLRDDASLINEFDSEVKEYKYDSATQAYSTYSGRFNPDYDLYRYLPETIQNLTGQNPKQVLGGESLGWSNGNGLRYFFKLIPGTVDDLGINNVPTSKPFFGTQARSTDNNYLQTNPHPNSDPNVTFQSDGNYVRASYSAYWGDLIKGYQRREKYRFAIRFRDVLGRILETKYIGDIKFPDHYDDYVQMADNSQQHLMGSIGSQNIETNDFRNGQLRQNQITGNWDYRAYHLMIEFDVRIPNQLQNNISGFEIVRVQRQEKDRTVLTQGLLNQVSYNLNMTGVTTSNKYQQYRLESAFVNSPYPETTLPHGSAQSNAANGLDAKNHETHTGLFTVDSPDYYLYDRGWYNYPNMKIHRIAAQTPIRAGVVADNKENPESGFKSDSRYTVWGWAALNHIGNVANNIWPRATELNVEFSHFCAPDEMIAGTLFGHNAPFINAAPRTHWILACQAMIGTGGVTTNSDGWVMAAQHSGSASTIFMQINENDLPGFLSRSVVPDTLYNKWKTSGFKWLVNVERDNIGQYGGETDDAVTTNAYQPCSQFTFVNSNSAQYKVTIGGGDVFMSMHGYVKADRTKALNRGPLSGNPYETGGDLVLWYDRTFEDDVKFYGERGFAEAFLCESYCNAHYRHGYFWNFSDYSFVDAEDQNYNRAYSSENSALVSSPPSNYICLDNKYPFMMASSKVKITGQFADQWLKFPAFNTYEVEGNHGEITMGVSHNSRMYVIQKNGISSMLFDPKNMITTDSGDIVIANGTGSVFADHGYLARDIGSQHLHSLIRTPNAFYFVDANRAIWIQISEGFSILSQEHEHETWFRDRLFKKEVLDKPLRYLGIHGYYNPIHKEVILSLMNVRKLI